MEDKLVKYETKEVERYERHEVAGTETLDRSDLIMPRVRVRQPVSKFGTPQEAGQFHNNITEQFSAEIPAVVLRVSKGRVMWSEVFGADSGPLCASDNAINPREGNGLGDKQEGPCATCPYSQWGDNHEPPSCSLVYTYLCANRAEDDMPFLISAMRTSAASAKRLNTLIKMFGIKKSVTIKTKLVNGDQGQWYELVFQTGEALPADEVQKYAGMAASLAAVAMTVDTENTGGADDLEDDDFGTGSGGEDDDGLKF